MCRKMACTLFLFLLASTVGITLLAGCDLNPREAGRRAGELYSEAETRAALDPTARAERRVTDAARMGEVAGTVAVEAKEVGVTVAAEAGERAPTVAAEAATAARDFSEGLQDAGACSSASIVLLCAGVMAALMPRRQA